MARTLLLGQVQFYGGQPRNASRLVRPEYRLDSQIVGFYLLLSVVRFLWSSSEPAARAAGRSLPARR